LIVDVQRGFVNEHTAAVPAEIERFLDGRGAEFERIFASRFVNEQDSGFRRLIEWDGLTGSPETDLCPEIERFPLEVLDKHVYSSMTGDFVDRLRGEAIQDVYLAGIDTDICVMHNAMDAFDAGLTPWVLAPLCRSHAGPELHRAALSILRRGIGGNQVIGYEPPDVP
jgi:nicotinamidase-related amidase